MSRAQLLIAYSGTGLMAAAFLGCLARQRYRSWFFFIAYLAAVAGCASLIALWPGRFYNQDFWVAQEVTCNVLRFGAALELAFRTFRWFPGARSTLGLAVLLVVLLTFGQVVVSTPAQLDMMTFLTQVHPLILNGSVWLFTVIAAFILWYRLPVNPFHKRVLLSYVPYLLLFTVTMKALERLQWHRSFLAYLYHLGFLTLAAYWTYVAWRSDGGVPATTSAAPSPRLGPVVAA